MNLCLFLTSGRPRLWVPCALAHAGEELVDLFQRQRVVQRFQRIDGRHHGAAFEACGRGETRRPQAHQPSVRPGSQKRSRQNHFTQHHRPNVTHPLHLNTVLLSLNGSLTRCELLPAADASLPRRQSCKNHAGRQDNMTPNLKRLKKNTTPFWSRQTQKLQLTVVKLSRLQLRSNTCYQRQFIHC